MDEETKRKLDLRKAALAEMQRRLASFETGGISQDEYHRLAPKVRAEAQEIAYAESFYAKGSRRPGGAG